MSVEWSLLFVAFAWGSTYLAAKAAMGMMAPATLLALRFGLAALVFAPFVWRDVLRLPRCAWLASVRLGTLLALSLALETLGINYGSAAHAGVLISMTVLFVPLLERIGGAAEAPAALLPRVLASTLGALMLTWRGGLTFGLGNGLVVIAAATRALHLVVSRKDQRAQSAPAPAGASVAVQVLVVGAVAALASGVSGRLSTDVAHLGSAGWAMVLYLALICTVAAFYLQMRAVKAVSASRVGLLLGTEPVFATLLAASLGGEALPVHAWLGAALAVAATALPGGAPHAGWSRLRQRLAGL